jgi:hypothetical protein
MTGQDWTNSWTVQDLGPTALLFPLLYFDQLRAMRLLVLVERKFVHQSSDDREEGPRSCRFQVNQKMFEQCAARIVNEVDTIDDLAMGMLAHKLTDKQIKQAY